MKFTHPRRTICLKRCARGLTLVELMIGMTLGLFVIGGVVSVFIANQQAARTTDSLSHIQENARLAFELMARDIRGAGGLPCGGSTGQALIVADVQASTLDNMTRMKTDQDMWYIRNFSLDSGGITGYAGTATAPFAVTGTDAAERVAGTDAISLSRNTDSTPITEHCPFAQQGFQIPAGREPFEVHDLAVACSPERAVVFNVLAVNNSGNFAPSQPTCNNPPTSGNGVFYGQGCSKAGVCNCSEFLGGPLSGGCENRANNGNNQANNIRFPPGSQISKLESAAWYIGFAGNGTGGVRNDTRGVPIRALYRRINGKVAEEIVEGVENMAITYLVGGAYVSASPALNWANVTAVRVVLTLRGIETGTSTDNNNSGRLDRTMTQVVTIRSRAL